MRAQGSLPDGPWMSVGCTSLSIHPFFPKEERYQLNEIWSPGCTFSDSSPFPSSGRLSNAHTVPSPLWPGCCCCGHSHKALTPPQTTGVQADLQPDPRAQASSCAGQVCREVSKVSCLSTGSDCLQQSAYFRINFDILRKHRIKYYLL